MRRWWIGIVLVATACATASPSANESPTIPATSSPAASPVPSSSPQPTTSGRLLFAALEAKGTPNAIGWNTLAIAGLDGYARAKTTFTPMPVPYVGCGGPVMPSSAQVAAGKVYFADGTGAIRSLAPHGQAACVTAFPLNPSQQMLSFAVSPDGTQVLGSIFTLPPKPTAASQCAGGVGPEFGPGNFTVDVYTAQAGGPAHTRS